MSNEWETLKEKGNEEFKKKNYNSAINVYSQAIGKESNKRKYSCQSFKKMFNLYIIKFFF